MLLVAAGASLALCSCAGRGAIFLTIEGVGPAGTLKIPDEVDKVGVTVSTQDGASALLDKQYPLGADQKFPLTLGLEPGGQTGARVKIDVSAFKEEQPVAATTALVAMNPQEVTSVTLRLTRE